MFGGSSYRIGSMDNLTLCVVIVRQEAGHMGSQLLNIPPATNGSTKLQAKYFNFNSGSISTIQVDQDHFPNISCSVDLLS